MKKHNYHFLLTYKLKDYLYQIEELKEYSFSKKVIFILENFDHIITYTGRLKINEKSKVKYLDSKKNIHLYMKKKLFRKLKIYHGKFNSYSIAIIVRMVISIFLEMIELYGFRGAIKKLKNVKSKLRYIIKIGSKKYRTVQLLTYLGVKSNKKIKLKPILSNLLL